MIGDRIKKLRNDNNITQADLAKKIGVTTSSIGMYETNVRKPSYKILNKIANYFKVSTDYLLENVENPNEFLIDDDEIPDVMKPFMKSNSQLIVQFENNEKRTQKERKKALEEQIKSINVYDYPGTFDTLLNLLPENKKKNPMSLYELYYIIGNDKDLKRKLEIIDKLSEKSINIEKDEDIRRIERARNKMTPDDKRKMMKILEASFEDYFDDEH